MSIADLRTDYQLSSLSEAELVSDPVKQFENGFRKP